MFKISFAAFFFVFLITFFSFAQTGTISSLFPRPEPFPLHYRDSGFQKSLIDKTSAGLTIQFFDLALYSENPFEIIRTYRSSNPSSGVFGQGWSCILDTSISPPDSRTGLLTVTEADGRKTRYRNDRGQFIAVKGSFQENRITRDHGGSWKRTWQNGDLESFDPSGRLVSSIKNKKTFLISYSDDTRCPVKVTGSSGKSLRIESSNGRLTKIIQPDGRSISYEYSGQKLSAVLDPLKRKTGYEYKNGFLHSCALPDQNSIEFGFSAQGNLESLYRNAPGFPPEKTEYSFQTDSRRGKFSLSVKTAGETEHIELFPNKLDPESWKDIESMDVLTRQGGGGIVYRTSREDGRGTSALILKDRIMLTGNKDHTLRMSISPDGTSSSRSARPGLAHIMDDPDLLAKVSPAMFPPDDPAISYDPSGRPVKVGTGSGSAELTWDEADRLTGYKTDRRETRIKYNPSGQPQEITRGPVTPSGAPGTGHRVSYSYDSRGKLIKGTSSNGKQLGFEYNASGLLTGVKDQVSGKSLRIERTRSGEVTRMDSPSGNHGIEIQRDSLGRAKRIRGTNGSEETLVYSTSGDPVIRKNSSGEMVFYDWDSEHRLKSAEYGHGARISYQYGPNGTSIVSAFPEGRIIRTYGTDGRVKSLSTAGGESYRLGYAPDGKLASVKGASSSRSYQYSEDGSLKKVTTGRRTTDFSHDETGRIISKTSGGKSSVSLARGPDGKLSSIRSGKDAFDFAYDPSGNLKSVRAEAGGQSTALTCIYNDRKQVSGLSFRPDAGSSADEAFSMHYDETGRLTRINGPQGPNDVLYDRSGIISGTVPPPGKKPAVRPQGFNNLTLVDTAGKPIASMDSFGTVIPPGSVTEARSPLLSNPAPQVPLHDSRVPGGYPQPGEWFDPGDGTPPRKLKRFINAGEYAVVYELEPLPGERSSVVKIGRVQERGQEAIAEMIRDQQKGQELLRQAGIEQLEITRFAPDAPRPYMIQDALDPGTMKMIPSHVRIEDFPPRYQEAVARMYSDIGKNGVIWEDGHLNNMYFVEKDGRVIAGVLDQDRICRFDDYSGTFGEYRRTMEQFPHYNNNFVAGRMESLRHANIPRGTTGRVFPDASFFMEKMLEKNGFIQYSEDAFTAKRMDPAIAERYFPDMKDHIDYDMVAGAPNPSARPYRITSPDVRYSVPSGTGPSLPDGRGRFNSTTEFRNAPTEVITSSADMPPRAAGNVDEISDTLRKEAAEKARAAEDTARRAIQEGTEIGRNQAAGLRNAITANNLQRSLDDRIYEARRLGIPESEIAEAIGNPNMYRTSGIAGREAAIGTLEEKIIRNGGNEIMDSPAAREVLERSTRVMTGNATPEDLEFLRREIRNAADNGRDYFDDLARKGTFDYHDGFQRIADDEVIDRMREYARSNGIADETCASLAETARLNRSAASERNLARVAEEASELLPDSRSRHSVPDADQALKKWLASEGTDTFDDAVREAMEAQTRHFPNTLDPDDVRRTTGRMLRESPTPPLNSMIPEGMVERELLEEGLEHGGRLARWLAKSGRGLKIAGKVLGRIASHLTPVGWIMDAMDAHELGCWLGKTAAELYIAFDRKKNEFLDALDIFKEEDEEKEKQREEMIDELAYDSSVPGTMMVSSLSGRSLSPSSPDPAAESSGNTPDSAPRNTDPAPAASPADPSTPAEPESRSSGPSSPNDNSGHRTGQPAEHPSSGTRTPTSGNQPSTSTSSPAGTDQPEDTTSSQPVSSHPDDRTTPPTGNSAGESTTSAAPSESGNPPATENQPSSSTSSTHAPAVETAPANGPATSANAVHSSTATPVNQGRRTAVASHAGSRSPGRRSYLYSNRNEGRRGSRNTPAPDRTPASGNESSVPEIPRENRGMTGALEDAFSEMNETGNTGADPAEGGDSPLSGEASDGTPAESTGGEDPDTDPILEDLIEGLPLPEGLYNPYDMDTDDDETEEEPFPEEPEETPDPGPGPSTSPEPEPAVPSQPAVSHSSSSNSPSTQPAPEPEAEPSAWDRFCDGVSSLFGSDEPEKPSPDDSTIHYPPLDDKPDSEDSGSGGGVMDWIIDTIEEKVTGELR